jgi:hypothetical protein
LYLARHIINGKPHFSIRQSYVCKENILSRELFDLGNNPTHYIIYPGGNAFYIDESVTDRLDSLGVSIDDSVLEDIFWPFLKPDVRRALEGFRHRSKPADPIKSFGDKVAAASHYHIFDRRRIYFLKFGRMDQAGLARLPVKLFRQLRQKSRDEIEQQFLAMETILKPTEYKAYVYVIFNLQSFFTEWFAVQTPQMLDQDKVDAFFVDEICKLNEDAAFWDGMLTGDGLHEYLTRYAVMYFDFDYAHTSFMEDYLRNFINSRRDYRPSFRSSKLTLSEASVVFEKPKSELGQMSRKELSRLYRKRAQKLHPDKGGDHETFVRLTRAYHDLLQTKN